MKTPPSVENATGGRFDLRRYLDRQRAVVDAALAGILESMPRKRRVVAAMTHSLMAGGKRLRPILCIAAAEAVGAAGAVSDVMPAACALEMIHTYSLIHDDLPAMDDDDLRRGLPTCHVAFDEATAILAGDGLLTLAFEVLSTAAVNDAGRAVRWAGVQGIIAAAAGFRGMIEGQMRDIAAEGACLSLEALEAVHRLKTGALIEAAVHAGALLGGGRETAVAALRRYARATGLAFQVTDDILNVEGDPVLLGKAVGTDSALQKNTYPALMGLEPSRRYAEDLVHDALKALAHFDNNADPLRALATYVVARKR